LYTRSEQRSTARELTNAEFQQVIAQVQGNADRMCNVSDGVVDVRVPKPDAVHACGKDVRVIYDQVEMKEYY
jgi:hypothetical protein